MLVAALLGAFCLTMLGAGHPLIAHLVGADAIEMELGRLLSCRPSGIQGRNTAFAEDRFSQANQNQNKIRCNRVKQAGLSPERTNQRKGLGHRKRWRRPLQACPEILTPSLQ